MLARSEPVPVCQQRMWKSPAVASAMASMRTTGRPFGKARQHQRARGQNFIAHLTAADPSGDAHFALEAVARNHRLDIGPHLAVAGQHQFEVCACAASRDAASTSSSCPFCSQRRPTQTRRFAGVGGLMDAARKSASSPQCTTCTLGHCCCSTKR